MKVTKVIFEYDNNERHSLKGKEAREWVDEVNSYIGIHSFRTSSGGLKDRKWKVENMKQTNNKVGE